MDETDNGFAYRCLPLLIANRAGWFIPSPVKFSVWWKGGQNKEDLIIDVPETGSDGRIQSHFGSGVLTFRLPYLFRSSQGLNLWVKGPTNWPKDGIQALEGIVETDWAASTFTMNWKLTRPNHVVWFDKGEPICMIVPVPRGLLESVTPMQTPLETNQEIQREYNVWQQKRERFLSMLGNKEDEAVKQGWEKDYFKGVNGQGEKFCEHQMQIELKEFKRG